MSGNNFARKVQRYQLRAGKINARQYRVLRRSVDVEAKDDEINAPIRKWVWHARHQADAWRGSAAGREMLNLVRQSRLREVIYHPTKGWRTRRGDEVEPSPI